MRDHKEQKGLELAGRRAPAGLASESDRESHRPSLTQIAAARLAAGGQRLGECLAPGPARDDDTDNSDATTRMRRQGNPAAFSPGRQVRPGRYPSRRAGDSDGRRLVGPGGSPALGGPGSGRAGLRGERGPEAGA